MITNGKSYILNNDWCDYTLNVNVSSQNTINKIFIVRYQNENYGYGVDFRTAPYNDVVLVKANPDNSSRILASNSFNNSNNIWYTVSITVDGNRILIRIDNKNVLEYIDNDNPFTHGGVGIGADLEPYPDSRVLFDDVSIVKE